MCSHEFSKVVNRSSPKMKREIILFMESRKDARTCRHAILIEWMNVWKWFECDLKLTLFAKNSFKLKSHWLFPCEGHKRNNNWIIILKSILINNVLHFHKLNYQRKNQQLHYKYQDNNILRTIFSRGKI